MGVVLPGDGDAAVHLGAEVGAQVGRRRGLGGRHRGGEGELIAARLGGSRRVPHGRRRHLGGHAHVGAVVLDGLEHPDRPAKLDALAGIGGGQLGALVRDADRLGGENGTSQVGEDAPGARQDLDRRPVEGEP